jgi:hypothetical protein
MKWHAAIAILVLIWLPAGGQTPRRMIDRCAQDGRSFWVQGDGGAVDIDENDIGIRIDFDPKMSQDAVLTLTHKGHKLIQKQKEFSAARGWLVTSPSAFAVTWNVNAYAAYTQIFRLTASGDIAEDTSLVRVAEREFAGDAKHFCRDPGENTNAAKWIDDDRLLLSIDAWDSPTTCYSNFTEGFILNVSANRIEQKLTERELIDLPAVCTWNVVPATKKRLGRIP